MFLFVGTVQIRDMCAAKKRLKAGSASKAPDDPILTAMRGWGRAKDRKQRTLRIVEELEKAALEDREKLCKGTPRRTACMSQNVSQQPAVIISPGGYLGVRSWLECVGRR